MLTRSKKRQRVAESLAPAPAVEESVVVPVMEEYGPSYHVGKEQYNLLKRHILSRHGKKKTKSKSTKSKKKKTTKKKRSRSGIVRGRHGTYVSSGPMVVEGRGRYSWGDLGRGLSAAYRGLKRVTPVGTFERLGRAAGGAFSGTGMGAELGGLVGRGVSHIAGFGDYNVRQNSIIHGHIDEGSAIPSFGDMGQGTCIRHREFIADIAATGSTAFGLQSFSINPGVSSTFP